MNPIITLAAGQSLSITGPISLSVESIADVGGGGETLGPELVVNGDFSAPTIGIGTGPTGWIVEATGAGWGVTDWPVFNGMHALTAGPGDTMAVKLTIPTTPGKLYQFSYMYWGDGGGGTVASTFNGVVAQAITSVPDTSTGDAIPSLSEGAGGTSYWHKFEGSFLATGPATEITATITGGSGFGGLDEPSVREVLP